MIDAMDFLAHLTDSQRRAVLTVDRSVVVSAAAGAGKTSVLAERCASLVCDVDPAHRCGVDELLVVTFTEAAAEEMRSRIAAAIQKRLDRQPRNEPLRQQLYQLDNAAISTIHAFCKSLIQRWFPQAGVDPQAAVLAGDEAELLKREVVEALFLERYAGQDAVADAFRALVDEYGGGQDGPIAEIVLRLHRFINSLPDPEGWLADAVDRVNPDAPGNLAGEVDTLQYDRLKREIALQIEYGWEAVDMIRRCWAVAEDRASYIEQHCGQLEEWQAALAKGAGSAWEKVAAEIRDFKSPSLKAKPRGLSEEESAPYDMSKSLVEDVRSRFKARLVEGLCRFSGEEYRQGLARITPHARTLADLVNQFEARYAQAKRDQAAVDFDDLQRFAFRLLTVDGDPRRPSEVARQVQKQYRYVLVDEFQDVDPLQSAILHCVSRESADPPRGNLFVVGDIKQSIYRFRLAEPDLFAERECRFDREGPLGTVIRLQENFRSRGELIDAINLVFEPLMRRSFGGTDYDDRARLRAGATYAEKTEGPTLALPAVEIHLLEPVTARTAIVSDDNTENGDEDANAQDSEDLEGIEREAFLIGTSIRKWMGLQPGVQRACVGDRPRVPGGEPSSRPIEFRDIVILLRSLPHKAEPIAEVLRRMGIPVVVERDAGSIDSTEFRDVVSLLQVLDNRRQDIPLAAVLRSPLMPDRFDENDLMQMRMAHRDVPFHECVARYADDGANSELRERVASAMARLDRYRERMRQASVADVLWEICEETGYLAYVAGLPGGRVRREHLLRLHDLARQFGRFARQGLHRFLRFVNELVRNELQPQQPAGTSREDAVRIMTIHGSKGLEFPVVILADAHKKFNLEDTRSAIAVDRRFGLGMCAVDAERRIRFPTLVQQLAAEHIRLDTLAEELRVWYVALTRAREHLVVIGRVAPNNVTAVRARSAVAGVGHALLQLELETAHTPLDWLLPAVFRLPADHLWWISESKQAPPRPLFAIATYSRAVTDAWRIPPVLDTSRSDVLAGLGELQALPSEEPRAADEEIEPIVRALTHAYPARKLASVPARIGVGELKRRWDAAADPDEQVRRPRGAKVQRLPAFLSESPEATATSRGTATHHFLQLVDLRRPCDAADLARQRDELIARGRLSADEARQVVLDGAAWFFATALGARLRSEADHVEREVAFVSRIDPNRVDPAVRALDDRDVVLIRGMADVVLTGPQGLELIDYKTDDVPAAGVAARAESHRLQIAGYAEAFRLIRRTEVLRCYLVFLRARQVVEVSGD